VAVTRLEFAEALVAVDRDTDARELLTQAQTTFAELRATPWLERADAAAPWPRRINCLHDPCLTPALGLSHTRA